MPPAEFAALAERLLAPGRFFARRPLTLHFEPAKRELRRWEVYKGELVPPEQTREEATFHVAKLHAELPGYPCLGPILSLLLTDDGFTLHILRGFAVHGHEAYGEGNVIQTRPVVKWLEERVGTLALDQDFQDGNLLAEEVDRFIGMAMRGTSRLAITSVESPHPLYGYGFTTVCHRGTLVEPAPLRTLPELLTSQADWHLAGETLDFALRLQEADDLDTVIAWLRRIEPKDSANSRLILLRLVFRQLSLTPDVGQAKRLLKLLENWLSPSEYMERLAIWLRQLAWHLTAFDLLRFHHQGANYPDAHFLDDLFTRLCTAVTDRPLSPNVRMALRLGSLLRKELEGLPVPERPTSPGENLRVGPAGEALLSELQFSDPLARPRRLFATEPFDSVFAPHRSLVEQVWKYFDSDSELGELGQATFLDRPLGIFKESQDWRRDQTPLAAYRMISRSIALRRLEFANAWGWLDDNTLEEQKARLATLGILGVAARDLPLPRPRIGVVCLEDANEVADDFVATKSLQSAARGILNSLDLQGTCVDESTMANWLMIRSPRNRLVAEPRAVLTFFDQRMRHRLEFGLPVGLSPTQVKYAERGGQEFPTCGLQLLHAWDELGKELRT